MPFKRKKKRSFKKSYRKAAQRQACADQQQPQGDS